MPNFEFSIVSTQATRIGNCVLVEDRQGKLYWLKIEKQEDITSPTQYRGKMILYDHSTFELLDYVWTDFSDWDIKLKRMLETQIRLMQSDK